jgi:hypothetical protein
MDCVHDTLSNGRTVRVHSRNAAYSGVTLVLTEQKRPPEGGRSPRARGWYGFWYGLGTVSARIGLFPCRPDPGKLLEITTFSPDRPWPPQKWGSGGRRFESGRPDRRLYGLP